MWVGQGPLSLAARLASHRGLATGARAPSTIDRRDPAWKMRSDLSRILYREKSEGFLPLLAERTGDLFCRYVRPPIRFSGGARRSTSIAALRFTCAPSNLAQTRLSRQCFSGLRRISRLALLQLFTDNWCLGRIVRPMKFCTQI